MTSADCTSGTDRCKEALEKLGPENFDAVINIQGDEPLIDPEIIDGVVLALQGAKDAVCSTAVTPLAVSDIRDQNRVKCVVDKQGYALYFSRTLIPSNKQGIDNPDFPYFLHLGIMCYNSAFLIKYGNLHTTPLQQEEDLEQLKILEHGEKIKVICVEHNGHGVDVPSDVSKVESTIRSRKVHSSA